jgi:hypothetical protein
LTQKLWNVPTVSSLARSEPTMPATRSRISPAALFVKVIARIESGRAPLWSSQPMRTVMTLVLPEPAPARTSTGPSVVVTARRCSALSASTNFCMRGRRTICEVPALIHAVFGARS